MFCKLESWTNSYVYSAQPKTRCQQPFPMASGPFRGTWWIVYRDGDEGASLCMNENTTVSAGIKMWVPNSGTCF